MKLHTKLGIDNGSKVTRPDFPKKIWFLDKRGKSVEKWQKIRFFGFLSKTSHGIFLKFGKKLQFNSRNNVTVPDFLKKIWFLNKRGKSAEKWQQMRFFGFFSKTSHGIFLKLGKKLEFNSRKNVTEPDFPKKIWFLDKRGKSAEKWQKMWFFGFFSKTSHGIFLKLSKKLEFNSTKNVTETDFQK